ncbi:MAG: hypothetical protein ACKOCW_10660 [Planctomycetaceae bacterium]
MPASPSPGDGPTSCAPPSAWSEHLPPADRLSVERRGDAIVVRVRSEGRGEDRLPDAVFSFRCGDPQYAYWESRAPAVHHRPEDKHQRPEDGGAQPPRGLPRTEG